MTKRRELPVPHVRWVPEAKVYIAVLDEIQMGILHQFAGRCMCGGPLSTFFEACNVAGVPNVPVGGGHAERRLANVDGWNPVFLAIRTCQDAVVRTRDGTWQKIFKLEED